MNRAALDAALRIIESTPRERITTHSQPVSPGRGAVKGCAPRHIPGKTGRPFGNLPYIRRDKIRIWRAQGFSQREIAHKLHISRVAVQKHYRALDAEDAGK